MGKSICFTGHRPEKIIKPYNEAADIMLYVKSELTRAIIHALALGYDTFYSGMARGVDIIASEIVLSLRTQHQSIRHVAVLPFRSQAKKWEHGWQLRHQNIIANSDTQLVLSEEYYNGCYFDRNRFMVENSQCVIAVYNSLYSGTGQTILFAEERGVEVVHIRL